MEPAPPGASFEVDVDARQVERAIGNLLTNAATYTPRGGSATMSLAHVFERFFRGDRARGRREGRPGGTGIGLTVALDLVAANGGRLEVEATSPTGTTFLVAFPSAG
ncbi:MAG TPA: ATP-binding protein [Candidatus Limnocylindrales bacterium]|nr:ATP-binding protein [Candidatus Limnocylindrales bacterium]